MLLVICFSGGVKNGRARGAHAELFFSSYSYTLHTNSTTPEAEVQHNIRRQDLCCAASAASGEGAKKERLGRQGVLTHPPPGLPRREPIRALHDEPHEKRNRKRNRGNSTGKRADQEELCKCVAIHLSAFIVIVYEQCFISHVTQLINTSCTAQFTSAYSFNAPLILYSHSNRNLGKFFWK